MNSHGNGSGNGIFGTRSEKRRRTHRGRGLVRLGGIALVALIIAMALMPLASGGVAAADEDEGEPIQMIQAAPDDDEPDDIPVDFEANPTPTPAPEIDDLVIAEEPDDEIDDVITNPGDPTGPSGEVEVNKLVCDDDYDGSYDELIANCVPADGGFTFHFTTQDYGLWFDGSFYEGGLVAGPIFIQEEVPEGYGEPIVICGSLLPDAPGAVGFQAEIAGGLFEYDLAEGEHLNCDWFNVPDGDSDGAGDLTVFKHDCPAEVDATTEDTTYLFETCAAVMEGVAFHLVAEDEDRVEVTDANGEAFWTDVPFGPFTLQEEIPAGYGDPLVYCGWGVINDGLAIDGMVPLQVALGGALDLELPYPGTTMGCFWFNIPTDDGSITVYKHTCPPDYDPNAWGANPELDCPELTNGILFTLEQAIDPDLQSVTGDAGDGMVFFGGLATGDYHLVESIPAGIVALHVECTSAVPSDDPLLGPALAYFEPEVIDGGIDLSLISGEGIVCHWYNIPTEDFDGGELIVTKYWCDGQVYSVAACELYDGGADFAIQAASGEGDPILFNTGPDGTHALYLPATSWNLWELDREWCHAESPDVDAEGYLVVTDGHASTVNIFNCGPGKQEEPPVKEFPNTGAGPGSSLTAGPEGDPIILHGLGGLLALAQLVTLAAARASGLRLTPAHCLSAARSIFRA